MNTFLGTKGKEKEMRAGNPSGQLCWTVLTTALAASCPSSKLSHGQKQETVISYKNRCCLREGQPDRLFPLDTVLEIPCSHYRCAYGHLGVTEMKDLLCML